MAGRGRIKDMREVDEEEVRYGITWFQSISAECVA